MYSVSLPPSQDRHSEGASQFAAHVNSLQLERNEHELLKEKRSQNNLEKEAALGGSAKGLYEQGHVGGDKSTSTQKRSSSRDDASG